MARIMPETEDSPTRPSMDMKKQRNKKQQQQQQKRVKLT